MAVAADLLTAIDELRRLATQFSEESFRLIVEGESFSAPVGQCLLKIVDVTTQLGVDGPTLLVSGQYADLTGFPDSDYDGEPWRLILGKTQIADLMRARDGEVTLLFFSVQGFHDWLNHLDPFLFPEGNSPDLGGPTTIRVNGLNTGFGGPLLWVLPPFVDAVKESAVSLPDSSVVHGLIHINAVKPVRVCPTAYALTWGNFDSPQAQPCVLLSAKVLAACLVQEFRRVGEAYEVMLRGTKQLSLPLCDGGQVVAPETLRGLVETVQWVYEERPETRLRLVMDRMSIDLEPGQSLLSGAAKFLRAALQQARDSYSFVILERKDAYHKEVRELMKDMKSQADLYAAKIRDLVNALTRDVLGVMVLIGFSFLGKFDEKNLQTLLASAELTLLVKVLSGYLVLSCVLQFSAHLSDASLAYEESKTWLDVLQHYSSQTDKRNRFLNPIAKRRLTFFAAISVAGVVYALLALATWNLPFLIRLLLAQ